MHNKLEPSFYTHQPYLPPPRFPCTSTIGLPCRTQCATHHCERVKNRKYENNFPRFVVVVPLGRCCCCCCCCCSCCRCCVKLSVVVAVAATVTSLTRKTIIMIIMLPSSSCSRSDSMTPQLWHRPQKEKLLQLYVASWGTPPAPPTPGTCRTHFVCSCHSSFSFINVLAIKRKL